MDLEKLNLQVDLPMIAREAYSLIEQVGLDVANNQLCLMHSASCVNKWHDGTGSLHQKSLFPKPNEFDFTIINSALLSLYLGETLKKIQSEKIVFRARLMLMHPRSCYSWHRDSADRLHLAITTNEHCRIAFDKGTYHIPADGYFYHTRTTQFHSAFNGSMKESRLHLVISYLEKAM